MEGRVGKEGGLMETKMLSLCGKMVLIEVSMLLVSISGCECGSLCL